MTKHENGDIVVNIGSMNGSWGLTNMGALVPSKWTLRGLTAIAAVEYSQYNIGMNSGAPSTTRTKMVEPEDIAAAAAFLLSNETRFIAGTTLLVDADGLTKMPNAKV